MVSLKWKVITGRGNWPHKIKRRFNTEAERGNKVLHHILEQPNDPIKQYFRQSWWRSKQDETKVKRGETGSREITRKLL